MKEVSIKDLGEIVTGHTPPKKDPNNYGGPYPFIKPTDMDVDRRHVVNWEESYSDKAFEKYKKAYIPPGATGVVTIGTVGEKIFQSHIHCFTNQSVNVVKPSEKYDNDYVYYLLKLNLNKVLSANPGTASGRHHVSKSNFGSIKIRVIPEVNKQEKIGQILGRYDDLIENNLKRINLLEQAAQNIYKEWFVNMRFPGYEIAEFDSETGLPEGWKTGKVSDLCLIKSGFAFKSSQWTKEGNPVLKIKNITNNTIDFEQTDFIGNEVANIASNYEIYEGDVLIAMTGATVGKVGLVPKNQKRIYLNQRVGLFRPLEGVNNIPLIFTFFMTDNAQQQILNYAQGAAQPNISTYQIGQIEILIPDNELLKSFKDLVSPFLKQIQMFYFQNRKLKAARDILLPRLMNQTIEV